MASAARARSVVRSSCARHLAGVGSAPFAFIAFLLDHVPGWCPRTPAMVVRFDASVDPQASGHGQVVFRRTTMKRTWTIIGVRDVAGSFTWYQALFGQPETAPAHDHFGQILDTDGTVLLCLHQWGSHEHPSLMSPDQAPPGNGLVLFFRLDDCDMAL